MTGSKTQIGYY